MQQFDSVGYRCERRKTIRNNVRQILGISGRKFDFRANIGNITKTMSE